ncbi:MAG: hypothetical protein WA057_06350 [Candidatus Magasanikiibacteriota bacterium]
MYKILLVLIIIIFTTGCATKNKNVEIVNKNVEIVKKEEIKKIQLNTVEGKILTTPEELISCGNGCYIYPKNNEEFVYNNARISENVDVYIPKINKFVWKKFESKDVNISFNFPIPLGAVSSTDYNYQSPKLAPEYYSLDSGSQYSWRVLDLSNHGYEFAGGVSKDFTAGKDYWHTNNYEFNTSSITNDKNYLKTIIREDNLEAYVFYAINFYANEKDGIIAILKLPEDYSDEFKTLSFYFKYPEITIKDIEKVINSVVFTKNK